MPKTVAIYMTEHQAQRIQDLLSTLADVQRDLYEVSDLDVEAEVEELCSLVRKQAASPAAAANANVAALGRTRDYSG